MSKLHSWFENMWWQDAPPPFWLRGIEPVYSAISRAHLRSRAAKQIAPPLPMISVGNISAGGSGKTPFVIWLGEQLQNASYQPVILCRGDGGKNSSARIIQKTDTASTVGDEARMLADLACCPVIRAADRVAGSHLASTLGDILILDDGFQYRHLQRCCDIVLIPASGVGNGHGIPAGPLREPVSALSRADIIIRTGSISHTEPCPALSEKTEYQWRTQPVDIIDIMHSGAAIPEHVYAVTAIARPQRFFDDLEFTGLHVSGTKAYPDHYPFQHHDVETILEHHSNIAVTAKDAVKLQALWPSNQPLWLLQQQAAADTALFPAIQRFLPTT